MAVLETGPSWKLRRRAVFGTLVFAAIMIAYVAYRWDDTRLAETLVLSMAGLMGAIVAAYTGFAAWEDRAIYGKQEPLNRGYTEKENDETY
jgi:multisubunit Na+/H+ antiporter MnhB subunit